MYITHVSMHAHYRWGEKWRRQRLHSSDPNLKILKRKQQLFSVTIHLFLFLLLPFPPPRPTPSPTLLCLKMLEAYGAAYLEVLQISVRFLSEGQVWGNTSGWDVCRLPFSLALLIRSFGPQTGNSSKEKVKVSMIVFICKFFLFKELTPFFRYT